MLTWILNKIFSFVYVKNTKTYIHICYNFILKDLIVFKNFLIKKFKKFYNYLTLNGLNYLKQLFLILIIDCCLMDDEPLWEPVEWTMVQSWLLFFFIFAWISETLISGRYGSYTGRDKRVYLGLFKAFWFMELWFNFNMFLTCIFIIVPFYFELTYTVSYIVSWWSWYDRIFFFKIILFWIIIDFILNIIIIGVKWMDWKKLFICSNIITIILMYLLFTQFINTYLAYFTDILWYKKTSWCDYNRLSHNPQKWGWGDVDRDHFNYHKTTLTFWFKNDSLYASALFFINMINFLLLIITIMQWILIIRTLYTTHQISYTFLTYGVSTLNMYLFNLFSLFIFILTSYLYIFIKTSTDFLWIVFKLDFFNILYINLTFIMNSIF